VITNLENIFLIHFFFQYFFFTGSLAKYVLLQCTIYYRDNWS